MLKRRNEEQAGTDALVKASKQSLAQADTANPVGDDGVSQCFRVVKVRMHVYLAPAFQASPIEGLQRQHLDPLLLQYSAAANGVVVSYSNVRLLRRRGTTETLGLIINECPFSFYWITANLLVWSPHQGDTVEGWVSVQSPGHIALLINDTFNASIKRAEIPASWEFVPQEDDEDGSKSLGYWKDEQGNRVDGKLQFTVRRFLHEGRTVLVLGSLLTADDVVPPQIPEKHKKHFEETEADEGSQPAAKKIKFDDD